MSLRILLLLIGTILYFLFADWFYTQKISGICCGEKSVATVPVIVDPTEEELPTGTDATELLSPEDVGPLTFNWSDEKPTISDGFDDFKSSIFREFEEDRMLEITGNYYAGEVAPDGYDNMGMARADKIRDLFSSEVPADRILTNSKLVDDEEGMEVNPFEAAEFNWIPRNNLGKTTVAEVDDRILIFFPFNSSIKDDNPEVDAALARLATHLQNTGDRVMIIGHTDSTGDERHNYDLGLQRAIVIRNLLVAQGADRNRIAVDSKGEAQPIGSNRTREGEQQNRRVVIQLIPEK